MKPEIDVMFLENKATEIRNIYLQYVNQIGRSHVGGSMSMCDIIVALFYKYMNWDSEDYCDDNRDRFILSKGHCSEILYAIYEDMGLFTFDELVAGRTKLDGLFSTHGDKRYLPMLDYSSGALGHGLSFSVGCALVANSEKRKCKVFCLLGDGEMYEGSNWEAIMFASANKLNNLIAIVDMNGYSSCNMTDEILPMGSLKDKFQSFGWDSIEIKGNYMSDICMCMDSLQTKEKPLAIIAKTYKGYGFEPAFQEPWNWHNNSVSKEMLDEHFEQMRGK